MFIKTGDMGENVRRKSHNLTDLTNLTIKINEGKMATDRQIEANRKNALRSTGPKTIEGKTVVSCNAIKHGILTSKLFVQEQLQEEFSKMREGFYLEFQPKGDLETFLLERIILVAHGGWH